MGKFLWKDFCTRIGVTQSDPVSQIIFNIVVGAVAREVLDLVCVPQESKYVLGWVSGESNLVFYTNDGRVAGRDHEWVHDALTVTVYIFCRVGIETNF